MAEYALSVPSALVGPHTSSAASFKKNINSPISLSIPAHCFHSYFMICQRRQSSNSSNPLPEYQVHGEDVPPSYPLDDLSGSPARPKETHTQLPRNETRTGASTLPLAEDYGHVQNGMNFDVEAHMVAANTDRDIPRMDTSSSANDARRRPRHTGLDAFANSFLLCAVIFWPINISLECHSTMSKVVFYGLPTLALFFLWMAMFQVKGCYAIKREGKTTMQYKRIVSHRLCLMLLLVIVSVLALWQTAFRLCRDGCTSGPGDGKACAKEAPLNASLDASSSLAPNASSNASSNASFNASSDPSPNIMNHVWADIPSWFFLVRIREQ
ncbi:hypothetical protein GJ744_007342 [Endocarpon pusillum]|uniref:Uncharacterized protein n=1 Tax=Endocarpon pusillum TaxID=364733 RepID=A0A8H7E7K4_9EURO|nr:hypothetical protein GJ744_007342 [Endocarpon pusillum]